MYQRALISVFDKTGLEEFLNPLVDQGLEIVSTGGTAEFLKSKKFAVQEVQSLTNFPEVLSGRVKTLHPHIFMSLLARKWVSEDQETLQKHQIKAFDLLIVNLYPFEKKALNLEDREKSEWIDIGGPSLLRAGAKNYFSIMTVCDPKDYPIVQKQNDLSLRKAMAIKVFENVSKYNEQIAKGLKSKDNEKIARGLQSKDNEKTESKDKNLSLQLKADFIKNLRYGENPHQKADWFKKSETGLHSACLLSGKELSYNNLLDFNASFQALREFKKACVVAVKHNNPCGVGADQIISSALKKALEADPVSVFGGVLAFNQKVDELCAKQLKDLFFEGVLAPAFSKEALDLLNSKKNLRILEWSDMMSYTFPKSSMSELVGGILVQTKDFVPSDFQESWQTFGEPAGEEIKKDLIFAWKVCAHLKSNAIAVVKNEQTLGLGMGQVNRVDAVRLALSRVEQFHPKKNKHLILASDAFFPFVDSLKLAKEKGVSWIIQPGGSIRDKEILLAREKLNLNMVLTGQRHFKH